MSAAAGALVRPFNFSSCGASPLSPSRSWASADATGTSPTEADRRIAGSTVLSSLMVHLSVRRLFIPRAFYPRPGHGGGASGPPHHDHGPEETGDYRVIRTTSAETFPCETT